jgi:CRISPR-associated protein Cas2
MAMTVVITRNVAQRFRGFLASCALEIAPGVYVAPDLGKAVRERIWKVCSNWYEELEGTSVIMIWKDPVEPGGLGLSFLGLPARELVEYQGMILARSEYKLDQGMLDNS